MGRGKRTLGQPSRARVALAKGAASLGAALARASKTRARVQRNRRSRTRSGSILSMPTTQRVANRRDITSYVAGTKQGFNSHFETIDCENIDVRVDHTGQVYLSTLGLSVTAISGQDRNWDLHPISDIDAFQLHNNPFGPQISNLANSYSKYRVHNLEATYIGYNNTVDGAFVMGIFSDPALVISTSAQLQGIQCKVCGPYAPLAQPPMIKFDFNAFYKNRGQTLPWLWVKRSGPTSMTTAEMRENFPGTLVVHERTSPTIAGSGAVVDSVLGTIRLRGLIEFCELVGSSGTIFGSQPGASDPEPPASLRIDGLDTSAVAAAPIASALSSATLSTVDHLDAGALITTTSAIAFGRVSGESGDGNYHLTMSWTAVVGASAGPPVPAIANTGASVLTISGSATSSVAPYELGLLFSVTGSTGNTTNFSTLTFTGPTGMTAGTCHILIARA